MMGNSVPTAKAVNTAAKLRWHDLSARVRRHAKCGKSRGVPQAHNLDENA